MAYNLKLAERIRTELGEIPFGITSTSMKDWLFVELNGCKTKKQLNTWVKEGVEFALTLTPK